MKPAILSIVLTFLLAGHVHAVGELPRTLLFVDDEDILYRPGTIKRVMEFKKHDLNPLIKPDKPWEGMIGWTSVQRQPQTGKYQLWYQAYQAKRNEDRRLRSVVCYAESDDGLIWRKPDLGIFDFYEETATNIVLIGAGDEAGGYSDRYCNSVLLDPHDPDPARRYKMLYYDWAVGEHADEGSGGYLAVSPDGIHWTKCAGPLYRSSYGGKGEQPPFQNEGPYRPQRLPDGTVRKSWLRPICLSDAVDMIYDPLKEAYVLYGKMWTPGPDGSLAWKHGMGRMESRDLQHWTRPDLVALVNDRDPPGAEFHTSPVFIHRGMYLSLNQMLDRAAGTIDAELMSSRDGIHWNREFANQWAIPRSAPGKFDSGSILTNATPVITNSEMRFYYGAYRGTAVGAVGLDRQVLGSADYQSGVGLATIPLDRFVAVTVNPLSELSHRPDGTPRSANTIGNVTLRALDLTGVTKLTLNADASRGAVQVEILDEDGYRIRGFSQVEAKPLTTDGLALEAMWESHTLADLPPGRYLIRIHLNQAELYAVTLHGTE